MFSIPLDSDLVLNQGHVAQANRRRRKSEAALHYMKKMSIPNRSVGGAPERRRNTLSTTTYQCPSPAATDETMLSPSKTAFSLCTSASAGHFSACSHQHDILMRPTSPLVPSDILGHSMDECEGMLVLTPLSPPLTPDQPTYSQLPSPTVSCPASPHASFFKHDVSALKTSASDPAVTCLLLDNRTIRLARPRLVQIPPFSPPS
ncbi:hypothetical protein GGI25_000218 [Coemansia spiralis]|uniref:Uncharacterized protein n=2 Tax=Coemansia TaxID=4863 RepID=A0A9W8G8G9_9FUNG|nr:hypothetical protein BX070DRAFT_227542 [Coemansia spiralis]KAJ1995907.1 hypothetical protein EDC05_000567 [Coemansia umbellata]KAJ2625791.1 hypothetical protein GGI26_000252 [Coemansia sp. RSA 1358]KAJ2680914.1 hypothetical protein GGI25_000218 [Coemansia spiralis]